MNQNSKPTSKSTISEWLSNSIIGKLWNGFSINMLAVFVFFVIAMIMQWTQARFKKEMFLDNIQFGFPNTQEEFAEKSALLFSDFNFEHWFFIPDMFFMLSICWIVKLVFCRLRDNREKSYVSYKLNMWLLIFTGGAGVIMDLYENFQYLGWLEGILRYRSGVDDLKILFIASFLVLFLIYCVMHFSDEGLVNKGIDDETLDEVTQHGLSLKWQPDKFVTIIKASIISILMLIVIALGLTFLDQGATLVVHLIDSANTPEGIIQICMTVILINLLAVILSHYPEYLQKTLEKDNQNIRWHINWVFNKYIKETIPGLITFTGNHYDTSKYYLPKQKYASYTTLFRYILGVLTYVAWFYVMYKAFDLYSLTNYNAGASVFLWTLLVVMIIYYLYKLHSKDSSDLLDKIRKLKICHPDYHDEELVISKDELDKVRPWINGYWTMMVLTLVFGLVALFVFYTYRWHLYSFYASIAFLLTNTFLYVFFRFTRVYSKYVWFSPETVMNYLEKDHELSFLKGKRKNLVIMNDASPKFYHRWVGKVSSNYYFLYGIRFFTILCSAFLVWTFFTMDSYITEFSTIPMMLSMLMVVYILIIYPIKFYLAFGRRQYDEQDSENEGKYFIRKKKFIRIVIIGGALLYVLNVVSKIDNLHKLYYVDSLNAMTVEEFTSDLDTYIANDLGSDSIITPMLQIASFGGGLKSNLWTLLVMKELDDKLGASLPESTQNRRILDYTISLSGVSGGAVGLSNYMILDYMNRLNNETYDRDNVIRNIGLENILSIDAAGIFGHDRLKSIKTLRSNKDIPNQDRSYYAMQRYMKILSQTTERDEIKESQRLEELSNSSLSEYWKKMREGLDHNPVLIINTASTGAQPGVSFSLRSDDIAFPGYIQLSDLDTIGGIDTYKDLRYYDAVSTSNRFPIMSPTAQIENEGFFLDGGYFENSGLLTTQHFLSELSSEIPNTMNALPVGTVSIINGKTDYVRRFIESNNIKLIKIDGSTNAAAIIAGITNIDKLPNVLLQTEKTFVKNGDELFTIYMPHPISIDDIKTCLGGDFKLNQEIIDSIKLNNEKIVKVLDRIDGHTIEHNGIVVPPLARTLSRPAVEYEAAMINYHEDVRNQMDNIIMFLVNGFPIAREESVVKSNDDISVPQEMNSIPTESVKAKRVYMPKTIKKNAKRKKNASSIRKAKN